MDHTVKHAEVVKDSSVKAVHVVYEPSSITAPFSVLVVLVALCLLEPHSARFTIIVLFLGHCSFSSLLDVSFCMSQQSGNLVTFLFLSVSVGCTRTLAFKKITPFVNLIDEQS